MGVARRARGWSLARQLLLVQLAGLAVLVAVGGGLAYLGAAREVTQRATDQVSSVARAIADSPGVLAAARSATTTAPTPVLQPAVERIRADTGIDFITVMSPAGIRWTHPNPAEIGRRFLGNTGEAVRGRLLTETYTGTLGPSVRAVAPVLDPAGQVVALVAVGITVHALATELAGRLVPLGLAVAAMLAVGAAGTVLISSRLRRETRGLAPAALAGVFASYEATLHAVREGLLLLDGDGRVLLANDAARTLLEPVGDPVGARVDALGLAPGLADALAETVRGERPLRDEIHLTGSRVLVLNSAEVRAGRGPVGTVVTLRDHTDLQRLAGELDSTRSLADALRAQAHESANRLHTVVSLVETGRPDEAVEFATAELALAQRMTDWVVGAVAEPVLAALLLGKAAEAAERGVELDLTPDSALDEAGARGIGSRELVTILGNLVDNAMDAAAAGVGARPARVVVTVRREAATLLLRVADSGAGVSASARERVFSAGWSTKPGAGPGGRGLGLALVGQAVRRRGGTVELDGGAGTGAVFTVRLPVPTVDLVQPAEPADLVQPIEQAEPSEPAEPGAGR